MFELDRNKSVNIKNTNELEQGQSCMCELLKNLSELRNQRQECNCQIKLNSMKERVYDIQWRSMKNSLVFTGIHNVKDKNTKQKLIRCFLYNELIEFGNVHRLGRYHVFMSTMYLFM